MADPTGRLRQLRIRRHENRPWFDTVAALAACVERRDAVERHENLLRHILETFVIGVGAKHHRAGVRHRLGQRVVRFLAGPLLPAHVETPHVTFCEQTVVNDHFRRTASEKVDDVSMHQTRPGPAADHGLEPLDAVVVHRDDDDLGTRFGGTGGEAHPPVVGRELDARDEIAGTERQGDQGRRCGNGDTNPQMGKPTSTAGFRHKKSSVLPRSSRTSSVHVKGGPQRDWRSLRQWLEAMQAIAAA
jgi:hypothetical protein